MMIANRAASESHDGTDGARRSRQNGDSVCVTIERMMTVLLFTVTNFGGEENHNNRGKGPILL